MNREGAPVKYVTLELSSFNGAGGERRVSLDKTT
jgi:hypothetical protein